jgi:hypothetical protein
VFVEIAHDGLSQFVDALEERLGEFRFRMISAKKRSTIVSHDPKWA